MAEKKFRIRDLKKNFPNAFKALESFELHQSNAAGSIAMNHFAYDLLGSLQNPETEVVIDEDYFKQLEESLKGDSEFLEANLFDGRSKKSFQKNQEKLNKTPRS
jgi:hypothetical protein